MTIKLKGGPRDGETEEIKHPGNAVFYMDECERCGEPVERRYERIGQSRTYDFVQTHECDPQPTLHRRDPRS